MAYILLLEIVTDPVAGGVVTYMRVAKPVVPVKFLMVLPVMLRLVAIGIVEFK